MAAVIGKKIVALRPMTPMEMRDQGWKGYPATVIVMDDGTILFASSDTEGNKPGVIFGNTKDESFMIG